MISISLIGIATALLLCAILAKASADEPKANRSQRAQIIERLLALSEQEKRASGTASSLRLRAPLPARGSGLGYGAAVRSNNLRSPIRATGLGLGAFDPARVPEPRPFRASAPDVQQRSHP